MHCTCIIAIIQVLGGREAKTASRCNAQRGNRDQLGLLDSPSYPDHGDDDDDGEDASDDDDDGDDDDGDDEK